MIASTNLYPDHIVKSPLEKLDKSNQPDVSNEDKHSDPNAEKYIFCRQCFQVITSETEKIDVQGGHKHTFANPHGLIFEIGCFKCATGCIYTGKPVSDFSWFKGFKWRLASCSKCLVQIGWLFVSVGFEGGSESFNGLILDRLVFPE